MKLAKDNVRPVFAEDLGVRLLNAVHFVAVTDDELTGFQGPFLRIRTRYPASLDRRVADAVLITEWLLIIGKSVAILPPDSLYSRHGLVGLSCVGEDLVETFLSR